METITLSEDHKWGKLAVVIVLVALGIFFLGRGIYAALNHQGGWTEITAQYGTEGCGSSFQFQYRLDDRSGNAEYHDLTLMYTSLCTREAKLYDSVGTYPDLGNLGALNAAPNQELSLEPELYRALEKIQASGNRVLYLAPLYEYYSCLFFCEREEETLAYDPLRNPELARSFGELAAFASDPGQIDLELLGENRARLRVSEEYLAYAQANGISLFVDFGWMKNAFILDDLAAAIRQKGFTRGYLLSTDGFGCNLCDTGESFSVNVFDRALGEDCLAAQLQYSRPLSFVSLRSYTTTPMGNDLYFEMADGQVRSIYVDPADGMPKTAMDDLLLWSQERGCADLVLMGSPIFTADSFAPERLEQLDCFYAYCSEKTLICSDPMMEISALAEGYRTAD